MSKLFEAESDLGAFFLVLSIYHSGAHDRWRDRG